MITRWRHVLNTALVFLVWFTLDQLSHFATWATFTWCAIMVVASGFLVMVFVEARANYTSLYPKRLGGAYQAAMVLFVSGTALLIPVYLLRASTVLGFISPQSLADHLLVVCGVCLGISINLFWMCLDLA